MKLSAEIMQRFVSHFCDTKRFQEVEACVVRLDPMQMDLNALVRVDVLRLHHSHISLIFTHRYVSARQDDFTVLSCLRMHED